MSNTAYTLIAAQLSWHCNLPLPCNIIAAALPTEWLSLRHAPIAHQQTNRNNHQCAINAVWTEIRARGRHITVPTQVMANNIMCFDTLVKQSPVNSEKYAALLCILIEEFENRFQDRKKRRFFGVCNSTFIPHKSIFQMECIDMPWDVQLKDLIMPLYQTFIRGKYHSLQSHLIPVTALAEHTFVNNYCQGWSEEK